MAGPNGLNDVTWDGATSVAMRFGTTKVPILKLSPPKVELKREKIRRVGEQVASRRTPGAGEVGDMTVELLSADYMTFILPRMGRHAGGEIEFVTTCTIAHPSVTGSLSRLMDHCSIVSIEGPDIESSEKGLITKLGISVLDLWEKGSDGKWKTLFRKAGMTSADAAALLKF